MPHLRELVKLYENQPFAIIGVNTGDEPEAFQEGTKKFGVTWISAFQGETTPIADLYRVEGYPTYYLLDTEGKIVAKGHSSKALDAPLRALMKALAEREDAQDHGGG